MFTLPRLAAVAAFLALASNARAQAPSTYAPPARPSSAPPAATPARPEPPVNFVATFGADFGSTKLLQVPMSDGSTRTLKANQGVNGSLGLAFLKLSGGRFATQATIGVEYSAITASNGSIRWLAFPLEIMEMAYLESESGSAPGSRTCSLRPSRVMGTQPASSGSSRAPPGS